jgi:hypothetical protein
MNSIQWNNLFGKPSELALSINGVTQSISKVELDFPGTGDVSFIV